MAVKVKNETAFAYAETLEILSFMDKSDVQKIPKKLMSILENNALPTYEKHINPNIALEEQNISEKTASLLGLFSLNYWCETQEEKNELKQQFKQNEIKKEQELNQKYSYDKLFNQQTTTENSEIITSESTNNSQIVDNSDLPVDFNKFPWYKKAFSKFKNFIYKLFKKANNPT